MIEDLTAYTNWQPLVSQGLPHCYRAVRSVDGCPVELLFFPAIAAGHLKSIELEQQLRLLQSVVPESASIENTSFTEGNPCLVRLLDSEMTLGDFAAGVQTPTLLGFIAELLRLINRTTRSRLYHGCINRNVVSVRNGMTPTPSLNFLHRFCLPDYQSQISSTELYQRDMRGTIDLCSLLIEERLSQLDSAQTIEGTSAQALLSSTRIVKELDIEPRQVAVLRKLCRERFHTTDINETFDRWLEFFDEFHQTDTQPVKVPNLAPEGTQVLDAFSPMATSFDAQRTSMMDSLPSPAPPLAMALGPGKQFGRYTIVELLGRGGMGAVYRGTDSATGQAVAIKVLRPEGANSAQAIRRFHKEARLLASLQNEHVTQLIEVGQVEATPFIAMEFVNGIDLKHWLRGRMPIDERLALRIIRDVASALVEAHQRGIIHRDIKPENVMLSASMGLTKEQLASSADLADCTLKLTDFGIAREIHQSQSMDVTRAGGILGTPLYMSPEQVKGSDQVGTPTDVYALGITLFELLCGSVPFDDVDFIKIAAKHCFEPIPDIRRRNAKVSEATSLLITRMLAKKAEERPASAGQLIREIDTILDGSPNEFAHHPVLPDFGAARIWSRDFEWKLKSTPGELWPHVSNTERLNRAMGVSSVEYRTEVDPKSGVRRFGSFRIGGVKVEWEEHPFEWIEGVRFGVLREFQSGPFKWFLSKVDLQPIPEGGTRLVHSVRVEPRSTLGRVISEFEAGWKGGRSLDRIYRRIDESIQLEKQGQPVWDRFEKDTDLSGNKLRRLEARIDRMIELGANLEASQKLSDYVRRAPVQDLARIRPLKLAPQLNVPAKDVLDTCLVAASAGLLEIVWDIICPTCRVAASNEHILSTIKKHTHCEACDTEFQSSVAQAIELTFKVHPEIRPTNTGRYCIGGPWHAPHVVTQVRLMPGERMTLNITLESGDYLLRTVGSLHMVSIASRASHLLSDATFDIGRHEKNSNPPTNLASGRLSITLINHAEVTKTVRLERTVERDQVVTAAAACSLPRFRELFPEQRFQEDTPLNSEELNLLVVQLHALDDLYFSLGDQAAYELVLDLLRSAEAHIQRAGGSVVRHTDGGLIAVFVDCEQAARAALAVLQDYRSRSGALRLHFGLGLHRGRTLIAQQDGHNDYFGATMRIAMALAAKAHDTLVASDQFATDPAVQEIMCEQKWNTEVRAEQVAGVPLVIHTVL